jgi:hypothetical protein
MSTTVTEGIYEQTTAVVLRDPDSGVEVQLDYCYADDHGPEGWQITAVLGHLDRFTHLASQRVEELAEAKQLGRDALAVAVRVQLARTHAVEMESVLRGVFQLVRDGAP